MGENKQHATTLEDAYLKVLRRAKAQVGELPAHRDFVIRPAAFLGPHAGRWDVSIPPKTGKEIRKARIPRTVSRTRDAPPAAAALQTVSPIVNRLGASSPESTAAVIELLEGFQGAPFSQTLNAVIGAKATGESAVLSFWSALRSSAPKEEDRLLERLVRSFRYYFSGVKVVGKMGRALHYIPIAEVHRPKIPGCASELSLHSTQESEHSFEISVVSLGGGVGGQRKVSFNDTIRTVGDCVRAELPIEIEWEECENKDGNYFYRGQVVQVGSDYRLELLGHDSDACGRMFLKIRDEHLEDVLEVPAHTTLTKTLSLESGTSANFVLGADFIGISFGLKARVDVLNAIGFKYELTGPNKYRPLRLDNQLSYCWRWQTKQAGRRPRPKRNVTSRSKRSTRE